MTVNRKKWASAIVLLSVVLATAGCRQASPKPEDSPNPRGAGRPEQNVTPPGEEHPSAKEAPDMPGNPDQQKNVRVPQQAQYPRQDGNATQQADRIAQVVTGIPGVDGANVLLTGRVALVGVDLKSNISGSKIDTLKFSVKEAAERTGKGYRAIVFADVDTVTRIRQMAEGVRSGRPISSFSNEIADILSRLVPEV
jgi:YhcN/YlaJ family sporulation lipoprotein